MSRGHHPAPFTKVVPSPLVAIVVQMIQGAIFLRPVSRFVTLLPWKPLLDFGEFAVDRSAANGSVASREPLGRRVIRYASLP